MNVLKPNHERANWAIISLWVTIGLNGVSLLSSIYSYFMIEGMKTGDSISIEKAELIEIIANGVIVVYAVSFIASAITFILWFRRAYYNLHQLKTRLTHSEGWAAGAWFVPFVNLFRPYQIMKEIYSETERWLKKNFPNHQVKFDHHQIGVWWGFWIATNILSRISSKISQNAESFEELSNASIVEMVLCVLSVIAGILAIKVIKNYNKAENQIIGVVQTEEDILTLGHI